MLPTKFQVNWPFGSGEEAKNIFSRRPQWRVFDRKDFSYFLICATPPMLPTKFRVNWPLGSGEKAKNRVSRWPPSWISDRNDFSNFGSTSHPDAFYQLSSQFASRFKRRSKKYIFKTAAMAAILDFWSKLFDIFELKVTPMLPTKFRVNWTFSAGEEAKNRFSRWLRTTDDERRTLTDHNSSPWALRAQVS